VPKESKKGLRALAFGPTVGQNKYELVIIAAREARHINEMARLTGEPLVGKVTAVALDRVIRQEVPFLYEKTAPEPPIEP
jgi:DNA-directed RNA polymerase subunit K/omega